MSRVKSLTIWLSIDRNNLILMVSVWYNFMLRRVLTSVNVSDSGCYLPSKTDVWQLALPQL